VQIQINYSSKKIPCFRETHPSRVVLDSFAPDGGGLSEILKKCGRVGNMLLDLVNARGHFKTGFLNPMRDRPVLLYQRILEIRDNQTSVRAIVFTG